jgi:hypothetical protein
MSAEDEARRVVTVDQAAFELPGVRVKVGRLLNSPGGRDLQNYVTGRLRRGEPWDPEDTRRVLELAGEEPLVPRAVASIVQLRAAGAIERDREALGRVHVRLQTLDPIAIVVIGRIRRERVR